MSLNTGVLNAGITVFLLALAVLPILAFGLCIVRVRHAQAGRRYGMECGAAILLFAALLLFLFEARNQGSAALRAMAFGAYIWPFFVWLRVMRATRVRWYDWGLVLCIGAIVALAFALFGQTGPSYCAGIVSHLQACAEAE